MADEFVDVIVTLEKWIFPLVLLILLVKVLLFVFVEKDKTRFFAFFYFNDSQIISSNSFSKVSVKIVQNCLSFYLLFLIVFDIILITTFCKPASFTSTY